MSPFVWNHFRSMSNKIDAINDEKMEIFYFYLKLAILIHRDKHSEKRTSKKVFINGIYKFKERKVFRFSDVKRLLRKLQFLRSSAFFSCFIYSEHKIDSTILSPQRWKPARKKKFFKLNTFKTFEFSKVFGFHCKVSNFKLVSQPTHFTKKAKESSR